MKTAKIKKKQSLLTIVDLWLNSSKNSGKYNHIHKSERIDKKGGRDTCPLFYVQLNLTKEESYG